MKRILLWIILLAVGFLIGFLVEYSTARNLENQLSTANQQLEANRIDARLCQFRDLASLTYLEASRKNYGTAGQYATRFFSEVSTFSAQANQPELRERLQPVLQMRDTIVGELAKGDPAVLSELQTLLDRLREATKR